MATTDTQPAETVEEISTVDSKSEDTQPDLMGYEGQIEAEDAPNRVAETVSLPNAPEDVQALINKTVKEVTVDENGKYIYPEGIDPILKAAVAATKSYRDNQSGFTKSQQRLKEVEAEVEALRNKLAGFTSKSLELSPEDQQKLDNLKSTNPDAWRVELNRLESEAKQAIQEELDSSTEEARQKASAEFELQRRYNLLDEFNKGRGSADKPIITPELLDEEVPPRITNKLAKGEITFEDYLVEVDEFLSKGKTVAKVEAKETVNLNNLNGSSSPSTTIEEEIDYSNLTF